MQPWFVVSILIEMNCSIRVVVLTNFDRTRIVPQATLRLRLANGRSIHDYVTCVSGLVLLLAEGALAEIVLLCWGKFELVIVIKTIKIIGMMGGNMLAVTNVAICANLAFIVHVSNPFSACVTGNN